MRKVLFALAVVLALLAVSSSLAYAGRDPSPMSRKGQLAIGLTGGLTDPVGQLARDVDLSANIGNSGLNLGMGWNGGGFADYYFTDRFAIGGFAGTGQLHMNDVTLNAGDGPRKFHGLVEGQTIMLGGYAKFMGETRGAWSPYAYIGAARFTRTAKLSRDILALYPGATVFEISDNTLGMVGGMGVDYAWMHNLTVGAVLSYDYSGELDHQFPWMGHQTVVHDWSFLTLHAVATWYVGREVE